MYGNSIKLQRNNLLFHSRKSKESHFNNGYLLVFKSELIAFLTSKQFYHTLLEEMVLYRTLKGSKGLRIWNP